MYFFYPSLHGNQRPLQGLRLENVCWSGSYNKDKLLIDKVEENYLYFDIYETKCILCLSYVTLTMGDSLPAARHDAITQLNDFGNADYLLGVVSLVGQQHQEEKYVGNDGL